MRARRLHAGIFFAQNSDAVTYCKQEVNLFVTAKQVCAAAIFGRSAYTAHAALAAHGALSKRLGVGQTRLRRLKDGW